MRIFQTSILILLFPGLLFAQKEQDTVSSDQKTNHVFQKRVLEQVEIDLLTSFYTQDGANAAVTGGIGTEKLDDFAGNIHVAIPLNRNDILTIDATVSAYSSASSSNLNPFSGASSGGEDDEEDDDDEDERDEHRNGDITGSPWVASSGASKSDVWVSGDIGYSHTSKNRNNIYRAHINFANEYDYTSFGGGIGYTKSFNRKNSEISADVNVYADTWSPAYPTEIKTYIEENGNLEADFFKGVAILDMNGNPIDKNGANAWRPVRNDLIDNRGRNTYSFSLTFSQILNRRTQISLFSDVTYQNGWLANPMQRIYFSDLDNFYIGHASGIENYTDPASRDVFQLADDIERLPKKRLKIPVGMRLHYYVNEWMVLKTYYRYYFDDWGIESNTFQIEMPVKLGDKFTLYPNYRFYNQTGADYFAPYEKHLSTENYYTSDYDLSEFQANQFGVGIKYTDLLTKAHMWKLGLKSVSLNYSYYKRTTGLHAHIVSFGVKYVIDTWKAE